MSVTDDSTSAPRFTDVRAVVVFIIMGLTALMFLATLFIAVPAVNHDDYKVAQGALLTAFAAAWGYYLGNSSGASMAREQVGKALDLAQPPAPSITLPLAQPKDTPQ
jgi:hypothetical protein